MLTGTGAVEDFLADAATLDGFDTGAVTLGEVEVLQAMFEIRIGGRERSLPAGLHPTNPPTFVVQVWRCADSPWGPFSLAQGRVGCRSGLRPRGFVQGCVCDNPTATAALRDRWGFPARAGSVVLRHFYDEVEASVVVGGCTAVDLRAGGPEPLGADDVAYPTTVVLARTPRGPRLVQVDADVTASRAERVRPRLLAFDGPAFGVHPAVEPWYPVSASIVRGSVTLAPLRFVSKPDETAFTGTERV